MSEIVNDDYRLTEKCDTFCDITTKKLKIGKELDSAPNSKFGNHFPRVSDRGHFQHKKFREIYNKRCAYCGFPLLFSGSTEFEIDHYISKSSKILVDEQIHNITNLVYSCNICNQGKKEYPIHETYFSKIHPDDGSIAKIFFRDEMYSIKIVPDYKDDEFINTFYKKTRLGSPIRKLDYLLSSLYYLKDENPKLLQAFLKLRELRVEYREDLR